MPGVWIPGQPQPQGSTKAYIRGGRAVITTTNTNLKPWRAVAAERIRNAHTGPALDCPVAITACFYLTRPKTPKFDRPATKPDLDKLVRAVGDALTDSGAIVDDSRIVSITAEAHWVLHGQTGPGVSLAWRPA